jgi:isopenicillin N synthase-like dioxygenase
MTSIPRLDLEDFRSTSSERRDDFNTGLRTALVEFGFVRITGHGINAECIRDVYDAFEAFFAGSDAEKALSASAEGGQRGFTPFGIEHAKDQSTPDSKEFFHVGRELPAGHPLRKQYPDNVWPKDNAKLRTASLAIYEALDRCASELLESLALAFALPVQTFSQMLRDGNSILRSLHYPPLLGTAAADTWTGDGFRAAPHEDINLITLLCEATDPGLEILTRDGKWLAVPAHPGEIIVDAGDMLSRVTNNVIPSATHRVVSTAATTARHRYSLPYFAHPFPDCDLSVLHAFVEPGTDALYPPITAGTFLEERLREIGLIS